MRVFFPYSSSRVAVAVGTVAAAVGIVVAVGGGFSLRAGPLRLSAHGLATPTVLAVLSALVVWWHPRQAAREAGASVTAALSRHAPALALILAATTAGLGFGFGTFAASATDPSGYVSQSELLAAGHVSWQQPLVHQVGWPNRAWAFAPLGYRPGLTVGTYVPVYPPGLPLVMAGARGLAGEAGVYAVVPCFGALFVLATYGIGRRLHSPTAGVVAAALAATSPVVLFHVTHPMSDVPAAALWALATLGALHATRRSALAGGLAAGLAVLTRPNLAPLLLPIAGLALVWPRTVRPGAWAHGRFWAFTAGALLPFAGLLAWQYLLYGSALRTGYGDDVNTFFATANILPNVRDYAWRITRGELPALAVAAASLAAWLVAPRGCGARLGRLAWPVATAATFAASLLVLYLPYGVFPDWAYLRFLLPAFPAAFVLAGALASEAVAARPAAGGVVLVTAMTLAGAVNVEQARHEQAFSLRLFESRYRTVGRYLESSRPPETVIVTFQESGSVRYYTRLPVVRWDLLDVDLEAAFADLRARGRRGLLLVEDWELPAFRSRFPRSPLARLDWRPRAEFGDTTHVWLYDPEDRSRPEGSYPTDRLH